MVEERKAPEPPSPWEWAVAALGLLLLLATLGYLLHDALTSADTPPRPVVTLLAIERQQDRFLVRLQVRNEGEQAAARLKVHGTLAQGDTVLEEAETEFDYVPGRSSRDAGLFFRRDPRAHRLELVPRSYQQP